MTIATFECIPGQEVTRVRKSAGAYVNGTWVDGAETETVVEAVVHPLTTRTRLSARMSQEIDNDRSSKFMVAYSAPDTFREMSEAAQTSADIVVYLGERYEVKMIDDWDAGVLDHQKALLARLDARDDD